MPGPKPGALPLGDDPAMNYKMFTVKVERIRKWLGREDSNPRMPGPKPGALPLGDDPTLKMAEKEGFEPSVKFPPHTLSRRTP